MKLYITCWCLPVHVCVFVLIFYQILLITVRGKTFSIFIILEQILTLLLSKADALNSLTWVPLSHCQEFRLTDKFLCSLEIYSVGKVVLATPYRSFHCNRPNLTWSGPSASETSSDFYVVHFLPTTGAKPRVISGKNIALLRYSFTVPVQHLPCTCSWFSLPLFLFSFCLFYFLRQELTECPRLALRSLCSPGKAWTWSPCASAFLVAGIIGVPHLPWLGRPIRQVPFMSLPRNVALNESSDFFRNLFLCVCVRHCTHHMGAESQTQVVWLGG